MKDFLMMALAIVLMNLGDDWGMDPTGFLHWEFWVGLLVWVVGLMLVIAQGVRIGVEHEQKATAEWRSKFLGGGTD